MDRRLPIFMDSVPEYVVKGDHVHIVWRELELVITVHNMLAGMASAKRAIEQWQRNGCAEVLEFRDPRGCDSGVLAEH